MINAAVHAGGLIYLSGTVARDERGEIAGKHDVASQTRLIVERVGGILTEAGSSLEHAVSFTVYLKSAADFQRMNDAYRSFWPKDPPTRTTVVTDLLDDHALVEMSVIAVPNGAERRVLHPEGWMQSPNPYSYGIRTGDTLFLSGLVARNGRDNSVVDGDVATQTRVVMENAGELLNAAGMSSANIVSARVFLPDIASFQEMNAAYRRCFTSAPPARATVKAELTSSRYNVEIAIVASSATRVVIDDARPSNPNLSTGIDVGGRIYLSGMLASLNDTAADAAAQTRETLASIGSALEATGCTPADVVDTIVYLCNRRDYDAMNDEYRIFFARSSPARTTVQAGLVPDRALVEIMVTAVRS